MSNIQKLIEFIESAPKEIKTLLLSTIIKTSMAAKNIEEDILKPDPDQLLPGVKKETRKPVSSLLESMRRGEYNHQYVQKFYTILKKADEIVNNSTPDELAALAEKYGMGEDNMRSFNFLNEDHKNKTGGKSIKDYRNDQISRRITTDDSYEFERAVSNAKIYDPLDHTGRTFKFPLVIGRNYEPLNKIEEITDFIHIKHVGGQHKVIEFFIPHKYWITSESMKPIFDEIIRFDFVSFKDEYGQQYTYAINNFFKTSTYGVTDHRSKDGYDVLKFNGVLVQNI